MNRIKNIYQDRKQDTNGRDCDTDKRDCTTDKRGCETDSECTPTAVDNYKCQLRNLRRKLICLKRKTNCLARRPYPGGVAGSAGQPGSPIKPLPGTTSIGPVAPDNLIRLTYPVGSPAVVHILRPDLTIDWTIQVPQNALMINTHADTHAHTHAHADTHANTEKILNLGEQSKKSRIESRSNFINKIVAPPINIFALNTVDNVGNNYVYFSSNKKITGLSYAYARIIAYNYLGIQLWENEITTTITGSNLGITGIIFSEQDKNIYITGFFDQTIQDINSGTTFSTTAPTSTFVISYFTGVYASGGVYDEPTNGPTATEETFSDAGLTIDENTGNIYLSGTSFNFNTTNNIIYIVQVIPGISLTFTSIVKTLSSPGTNFVLSKILIDENGILYVSGTNYRVQFTVTLIDTTTITIQQNSIFILACDPLAKQFTNYYYAQDLAYPNNFILQTLNTDYCNGKIYLVGQCIGTLTEKSGKQIIAPTLQGITPNILLPVGFIIELSATDLVGGNLEYLIISTAHDQKSQSAVTAVKSDRGNLYVSCFFTGTIYLDNRIVMSTSTNFESAIIRLRELQSISYNHLIPQGPNTVQKVFSIAINHQADVIIVDVSKSTTEEILSNLRLTVDNSLELIGTVQTVSGPIVVPRFPAIQDDISTLLPTTSLISGFQYEVDATTHFTVLSDDSSIGLEQNDDRNNYRGTSYASKLFLLHK